MLSRELFADALQEAAAPRSVLADRAHADLVADLCVRAFETQADVAAELGRAGSGRRVGTVGPAQIPDIRVYDAAEHASARRTGATAVPMPLLALTRRAQRRAAAPGAA